MNVALLQTDIVWGNPKANIRHVEKMLSGVEADICVLPEMWSTGFVTDQRLAQSLAIGNVSVAGEKTDDEQSDNALGFMISMARKMNAAFVGSLIARDKGTLGLRNRQYFVFPDGSFDFYDKRHLFTFGGEDKVFEAGQERKVISFRGVRFLMLTCYDLRFPVWSRYRGDYDAIVLTASWSQTRQQVWNCLTKARAIENQCALLAVNRVGNDPKCSYSGGSRLVDAKGGIIVRADEGHECVLSGRLDMAEQEVFRAKFRVLQDRD